MKATLKTYLQTKTAITDLVANRIYLMLAPQGVLSPYIVIDSVTEPRTHHLGGATGIVENSLFQITAWAINSVDATAVKEALRDTLDGFYKQMGSMWIQACLLTDVNDELEEPKKGGDSGRIGIIMEFQISYNESIPSLT